MRTSAAVVREAKMFTFYARRFWPVHRQFVKRHLARRCAKCIASEKIAALDEQGLCPACRTFRPATEQRTDRTAQEALHSVLRGHEGKGALFDALALFSGGKDSAFMIDRIRQDYPGLRMLALTVNNTFMSPVALDNVRRLVPRLGTAHLQFRPPPGFMEKLFRYGLTHLNENGGSGTVDYSDGEFVVDTARNLARRLGIPLILCGCSKYQVEEILGLRHFESPPEQERAARTHVAGLDLDAMFSASEKLFWRQSVPAGEPCPRLLFPLYAWNCSEGAIVRHVRERGLLAPGSNHPMVTNHALIPLLGAVDVHRTGYTSFEPEFCRMVREGKARATEWRPIFEMAEYASRTGAFVRRSVADGLRRLSLTPAEVGLPTLFGNGDKPQAGLDELKCAVTSNR